MSPFNRPLNRMSKLSLTMVRTMTVGAVLFLAASAVHAQGKEARGGTDRFSYPQSSPEAHGVFAPNLELRPSLVPPTPPPSGIVSAQELGVPSKAAKEYDRSIKASQSGDYRSAVSHLEKAIHIAPDFAQAHNNLGVVYIHLQQYENAAVELQKTIDLNPHLETPYHNLGMVMMVLGRLPEAEAAARQAFDLAPQQSASRYTLGRILALQGRNTPEAVSLLTKAAVDTPEANLVLAHVLQNRGEFVQAAVALRSYLQNTRVSQQDSARRARVEAWLAKLTNMAAAISPAKPASEDAPRP